MTRPVLAISGLRVDVAGRRVLDGLDLELCGGAVTALVGRSGSGKSLTARALVGLLPDGATASGTARFDLGDGRAVDLLGDPPRGTRPLRGSAIGYAFQEARASLNPGLTVGRHLTETLRAHGVPRRQRRARGVEALRRAGLEDPAGIWPAHPFELSGGQAQRVALALATALGPRVLIADEITSALDPVTQAAVLDGLAARLACPDAGTACAVLLITHDLAVAGRWADRVAVLDGGRIVEDGPTEKVLAEPARGLTRELVRASGLATPVREARRAVGGRA